MYNYFGYGFFPPFFSLSNENEPQLKDFDEETQLRLLQKSDPDQTDFSGLLEEQTKKE